MTEGSPRRDDELDFRMLEPEQARQYVSSEAELAPFLKVVSDMEAGRVGMVRATKTLNTNKIKRRLSKAASVLGRDIIIYDQKDPTIVVFKVYDPPA